MQDEQEGLICNIEDVIENFCQNKKIYNVNLNSDEDKGIIEHFQLYNPPGDGDCFFHCIAKYLKISSLKNRQQRRQQQLHGNNDDNDEKIVSGKELRNFMSNYIHNLAFWVDKECKPLDVSQTLNILQNQKIIVKEIYADYKNANPNFSNPQLIRELASNEILHFYPFILEQDDNQENSMQDQLIKIAININNPQVYIGDELAITIMQILYPQLNISVLIPQTFNNGWVFKYGNLQQKINLYSNSQQQKHTFLFLMFGHYYLFVLKK